VNIKNLLKKYLPIKVVTRIRAYREARAHRSRMSTFARMGRTEAFSRIYQNGEWGSLDGASFYSGGGSNTQEIVDLYLSAVKGFVKRLGYKPTIVDIGCGDFSVGSRLVEDASHYTACDLVPDLIHHLSEKFHSSNLTFQVLDVCEEVPPSGDVLFLRQVLQHLTNQDIKRALSNINGRFRYLILTEHLPAGDFKPNKNKNLGPGIRISLGSGVVITDPPFLFGVEEEERLVEVGVPNGVIRTTAYTLASVGIDEVPRLQE